MAATPNFGWELPTPGASVGVWGDMLNEVFNKATSPLGIDQRLQESKAAAWVTSGSFHLDRIPTLPASKIGSGTLDDARLSANVPLKNAQNDFSDFQRVVRASGAAFAARIDGDASSRLVLSCDGSIQAGGSGSTAAPVVLTAARVLQNVTANADIITAGAFHVDRIPSLPAGKITSGEFSVARGGTGRNSLTSGSLLIGAGTSQVTLRAPGAAHGYLYSTGSTWDYRAITVSESTPSGTPSDGTIWMQV